MLLLPLIKSGAMSGNALACKDARDAKDGDWVYRHPQADTACLAEIYSCLAPNHLDKKRA